MSNLTITERIIRQHQRSEIPPNGLYIYDTEVKGFGVRISPTCITWFAQKSIGKKTQRVVIGHYPAMSIKDARIEAGHTIVRLSRGEDVNSSRAKDKAAKVERLSCPNIKEAVADYLKDRGKDPKRDSNSRYEIELAQLFNRQIVPELGASTRINEVTKANIKAMIKRRKDAEKYVAARNLYVLIRPFFQWCISEEYISTNPCAEIDAPEPAQRRQHKLSDTELAAFWSASFVVSDEVIPIGTFWRLLLMLIQRRGELGGMRWREINLDKAEWIIPGSRTKNGREHLVPLPKQAIDELRKLTVRTGEADYVFGKYPSTPFSGFSKAKGQLEAAMLAELGDAASLSDWRIHDLRRSGASGIAGLKVRGHKVAPHIIEAILNHTPGSLEGTYQVWDLYKYADEKREALAAWSNCLSKARTESSNVTKLFA